MSKNCKKCGISIHGDEIAAETYYDALAYDEVSDLEAREDAEKARQEYLASHNQCEACEPK